MKQKLYCYVDETGQDTKGKLFLVAIVLKEIGQLEILDMKLQKIKRKYLEGLLQIKELKNSMFYSIYENTKEYTSLTSFTVAKAVLSGNRENYTVTVIIDGLNDKERDVVRTGLKKLKIKYNKIRGMRDEQNIFLRLSDAMAGFLREVYEKHEYAVEFMKRFKDGKVVTEA